MSDHTALLVIDCQIGLITGAYQDREVLDRIATLIERARTARRPVVYLQHNHATFEPLMEGNATWRIHPKVAPIEGDVVIGKTASDGFYKTPLHDELAGKDIQHLVVTGAQTEFCVDTTCRRAISLGYDVTLVSDAHTTGDGKMPAEQIITYHNTVLSALAHPDHKIAVKPADDVEF